MATAAEESFKVCGLCSQLVDESVEITIGMRMFLCGFLTIQETTLPSKVCLECYQKAMDCRSFKERCDKAIHKLHKRALYSSMILGGSPAEIEAAVKKDRDATNATKNAAEVDKAPSNSPTTPPAKPSEAKKGNLASKPGEPLPAPMKIERPGPRSRRSSVNVATPSRASGLRSKSVAMPTSPAATTTPVRNVINSVPAAKAVTRGSLGTQPKVTSPPTKAEISDNKPSVGPKPPSKNMGYQPKVVIKYNEKEMAEKALKMKLESASKSTTITPQKNDEFDIRKRKGNFSPGGSTGKKGKMDEKAKKMTSSGRVVKRNSKTNFIFDDAGGMDEDSASKTNQVVAKKSPPAKMDASAPKSKPGSKTKKKQTLQVEEPAEKESVAISDDEDTEEIFPTVGPYQCEICQKITDTKQEFVDHIKKAHIDVVDEEVLRSLEGDLRKSRKKMELAISRMPAKGPAESKKPKPASKKTPVKKVKGKPTTVKKKVSKTQKPKEVGMENRICKICKSVLSSGSKREYERHIKSKYCMGISIENSAAEAHAQDPLSTPPKKGSKQEETADELAERTCQFCGKVLKKKTDLSGHYKTKVCVARQYEREENQSGGDAPANLTNTMTKDSNTPKMVVENTELDEGFPTTATVSGLKKSSFKKNLTSSSTDGVQVVVGEEVAAPAPFAKAGRSPNAMKTLQPEPIVGEPLVVKYSTPTTSKSLQNPEWLVGPKAVSDTCNGTLNQGEVDPLTSDAADPFVQTPGAILGNGVVHSPNNDNASMF